MQNKIVTIAEHYGLGTQLLKLAEESAEYSAASAKWTVYNRLLSKTGHNRFKEKRDVAAVDCMKEVADVLVLARQVEYLKESDPEFKTEVEKLMDEKCNRQLDRIDEELQNTQGDKLDLKDTIDFMLSDSMEERMIAEYQQLAIRKNKLGNFLWAIKQGKTAPIDPEIHKNLWQQFKTMTRYKKLLEEKARLMKMDLKEITHGCKMQPPAETD
ncbi:hypothetical protein [uncultured Parasutterella sp.]|uniref:crAss001_48 related protein n=1 Tax=uncultured Parasutterella sp. TaxID=1263098 RepID=UPI00272AD50B|nr:hypothetical protein [uncultured Parasutterella sp.]